jgi:hypothetical protein
MFRKKQTKTKREQDIESQSHVDDNHDYSEERTVFIKEFDMNEMPPQSVEDNNGVKIVVIGKPGCFAPGTEVLMYDGCVKKVEDIVVGDKVMGDDGETPRTVQKLYHDEDEMYKIIPEYGTSYVVNRMHDLLLYVTRTYGKYKKDDIIEISVNDYINLSDSCKKVLHVFRNKGVTWENKQTSVDPYEAGCNVLNKKTRHICNEYRINDRMIRQAFLAGVVDTCGKILKSYVSIDCKYESLANDIAFIARSLGIYVEINRIKQNHKVYLFGKSLEKIPFRNQVPNFTKLKDIPYHSRFTILSKGKGEYYGFTLQENRRFCLASFEAVLNTGKSSIIASIVDSKKHIIPVSQIFSGTEDSNGFYCSKFPSITVYNSLKDLKPVEQFISRQKYSKRYLDNPWAVQIIDDCTDDAKIFTKPLFQSYYKNGRHWKMMHILSLQYCLDIKPVIRTNIDYTFLCRESSKKNRKSLFENYASCVDNQAEFETLLDSLTSDYTSMVIVNRNTSNNIEDCIRWYKADLDRIKNFKFGAEDFWLFNNDRLNSEYEDPVY